MSLLRDPLILDNGLGARPVHLSGILLVLLFFFLDRGTGLLNSICKFRVSPN